MFPADRLHSSSEFLHHDPAFGRIVFCPDPAIIGDDPILSAMKQRRKLRAYWSRRERDLILSHPVGTIARADARWLYCILNKTFISELERRGYNPETIRFSVEMGKGE